MSDSKKNPRGVSGFALYLMFAAFAFIGQCVFDPFGPTEAERAASHEQYRRTAEQQLHCNLVSGDFYECRPREPIHYAVAERYLKVMGLRVATSYDLERYGARHHYPGDVYALGASSVTVRGDYAVAALRAGAFRNLIVEDYDGCDFLLQPGVIILAKR